MVEFEGSIPVRDKYLYSLHVVVPSSTFFLYDGLNVCKCTHDTVVILSVQVAIRGCT